MLKRLNINRDDDDDDDDNDEEILRQQAEFFKQKAEKKVIPAATIIQSSKKNGTEDKMDVDSKENESVENIQDQLANTFEAIPTDMKLSQVKERRAVTRDMRTLNFDSGGFPKAVRRDMDIKPKKGSIFSQHIKRLKRETTEGFSSQMMEVETGRIPLVIKEKDAEGNIKKPPVQRNSINLATSATTVQKSDILSSSDRQSIHNENLKTLNGMSQEEILAEREKLISTLDPALVQFLRSQRSKNPVLENRNQTIKEQNEAADTINLDQLKIPKDMLSMPEATGWLHFNKFEANKLAWMKDLSVTDLKNAEGFEARFDFEGYLLPYSLKEIDDSNRHLYHHGEEPERPGYTLQELLLLSRSNVLQQRIIALNTLGNILGLNQTGIYDNIIDIPIEQIFFVLRVCMDDNTPSVLTAAVKALRNLIYFQIDETCLDNMMSFGIGSVQPILAVDHDTEDDDTVNDQQLAETNLIKCLTRTDILVRIRYIINTVKPPVETIIYCIEILIRLSRDSQFVANNLIKCEGLFDSLVKYFVPLSKMMGLGYSMPLPQMVKLLRIISSRHRQFAVILFEKYGLLDILILYLCEDYFSQNAFGMRLQIECMHYWALVLHYGLGIDSIRQYENLLFKLLDYHFKNTDNIMSTTLIRQTHVSALLLLLSKMVEKGFNLFPHLVQGCLEKWTNQFKRCEQFKCGNSQITSAMFYYATICNRNSNSVCTPELLESLIDSDGFNVATCNIINGSLLLNNYETHKTTANLKSLEAATWFSMDHIVPVLQTNSCIPFLYAFSSIVLSDQSFKVKTKFLHHPRIKKYAEKLKAAKHFFNVGNWFTRCESFLIMNLLKIAQRVQNDIDPTLYYDIAVKGLCIFSAEQKMDIKYVLDNIIFCPRFYSVEVAMANTRIAEKNDELGQAWKHLEDVKKIYTDVLGITSNLVTFETALTLDMSIGNVIPIDWIYTPLVMLYSNQQKRSKDEIIDESKDLNIVLNCLRWILIYETYFESLADSISPTEKYVRLGCLFLGSDDLFLHGEVQGLLTLIYQFLVKNEKNINFEQEIAGLTNFKDFFIQLLEQYQGVSYGNKVFGNVLLFALMKRHNIKYRKTLWSEYMGVVETFAVATQEVWLNKDDLINPIDTDISLYNCYWKALATKAVPENTIMHEIAARNVRLFKQSMEEN